MNTNNTTKKDIGLSALSSLLPFLLLAILKIFLISHEEIIALNAPHDDLWFIQAAARWFWFTDEYNLMTIIHLPAYAIYIALIHLTGIPLRIGIELTFLASGLYLVYALRQIGLSKIFCLAAYALIVFNPASFHVFNRSLSETLYSVLLMLSLAGITLMLVNINTKKFLYYSVLSGFFMALLWLTREEGVLIAGIPALTAFFTLLPFYRKKENWKTVSRKLKIAVLLPIAIIAFFSLAVHTANYFKFGLFAASALDSSSYKKAYSALLSIKPEKQVRFVPVTTDAREKAYSVSPAFKELQPFLENRSNLAFYWSKASMGIENEMAAGWFYWTLRESVNSAGYKTATEESRFYERMATEINKAADENKFVARTVPVSIVDPASFSFLPSQGFSSLKKIWQVLISTEKPPKEHANLFSGESLENLDYMANRRIALIETKEYNAVDEKSLQKSAEFGSGQSTLNFIWLVYGKIMAYLTYFGFLLLAVLAINYKKIRLANTAYLTLLIFLFVVLSHIFLFVLLDVNSWPGNNLGYLFPIMPIFSSLLVLFISQTVKEISKNIIYNQRKI